MAGVSVQAFRRQGRRYGAGLVCSEMVSVAGIQHRNERTLGYLRVSSDEHPLAIEWNQTLQVYHSLKRGYRPIWHGTYPEVLLLLRSDGQMRAMVDQGQHRVSSLSHLGYKKLSLLLRRHSMRFIREDEVERWYYVCNGLCTKEQALRMFNAYFELNGRERARYLNLHVAY